METGLNIRKETQESALEQREQIPLSHQVVVATNFLYREYRTLPLGVTRDLSDTDGVRGDLALETLAKAARKGVRVVACDGGSSSDFQAALETFKPQGLTVVTSDIAGRAPQRRRAFETAANLDEVKAIVYLQPEKEGLIDFLPQITEPILAGKAELVVPQRNSLLFKQSYPPYMRDSELWVNKTYDRLMHHEGWMDKDTHLDWFFGPVVFRNDPEIINLFLKRYELTEEIYRSKHREKAEANPEKNSGSHYFPIIEALFLGKPVVSVEIPFVYPKTQLENEMSPEKVSAFLERRILDGAAYRLEALHFISYLKGDPESKIRLTSSK